MTFSTLASPGVSLQGGGGSGGGGGGTPGGSNTQLQYNSSGTFAGAAGLTTDGTSLTITGGNLTMSGNISAPAWTTSGVRINNVPGTLTDTTSSGTVAAAYTIVFGGNTIAASNVTTFTNYFTTYINTPTAGTNVSFTNRWALGLGGGLQVNGGTLNGTVLDVSQTWGGTGTYTGIRYNVTDSGPSNAASLLMDLQVGGSSRLRITKAGVLEFNAGTTEQIWSPSAQRVAINANGIVTILTGGVYSASTGALGFRNGTSATADPDVFLSRRAAANLRLGAADAAAPAAQTLSVQSVVAGTSNTAGANLTITGSQGTGTGAGGSIIFQVAPAGSSGTAQNALATALTIAASKVITVADTYDIAFSTTTGTKIGTATTQKLGFWNAAPIAQPTTAVAAATVAATGTGDVVAASTTFDGYTIPQIVKALRNAGLLA